MPFNHTPGPWHYCQHDKLNPDRAFGIVADDDCEEGATQVVAEVCVSGDPGRAEDDAALIAASPAMLAALRRLTFAALCRESTMGDPCRLLEVKAELAAAAAEANALIAKTTEGRA